MKNDKTYRAYTLTVLWAILFAAGIGLLIWKSRYGFGSCDEPFYYTIPHRLMLGDRLFADEWHLSQLSSFFIYPFISLFYKINGSLEGLVLTGRYVYIVIHSALSVFIFLRLRKFGLGAALASLMYLIFAPFDVMAYSYNTVALDLLCFAGLNFACGEEKPRLSAAISGFAFAGAVICCPYLTSLYFIYALVTVFFSNKLSKKYDFVSWRVFISFTCGIFVMFVLFCLFFFRFSGISELLDNVGYALNDVEHPRRSIFGIIYAYIITHLNAGRSIVLILAVYSVMTAVLLFDKKRTEHALIYFMPAAAMSIVCYMKLVPISDFVGVNFYMFSFTLSSVTSYLLLKEKPVRLFWLLFVPALVYSFCISMSSNLGFKVVSMTHSVASVAGAVFVFLFIKQYAGKKPINYAVCALAALLAVTALSSEVYVKCTHCYWSCSPAEMPTAVEQGPAKGLHESGPNVELYNSIYDAAKYFDGKEGKVLAFPLNCWEYLILEDLEYATPSAWQWDITQTLIDKYIQYFEVNPEKRPDYVWIRKSLAVDGVSVSEFVDGWCDTYGYSLEENDSSYYLIAR